MQVGVALLIFQNLIWLGMALTVELNHEGSFRAVEIHNVWADAVLPSEFEAVKLSCAKL